MHHRLYYSPGACSLAAHIVLEEIGEPYDLELVSSRGRLGGEDSTSPAWIAQNPKRASSGFVRCGRPNRRFRQPSDGTPCYFVLSGANASTGAVATD